MPSSELSPEVQKVLSFLELLIVANKMGIREFERQVGLSHGTLARLLSGKITLTFQRLLDMLKPLKVPPQAFFAAVFSIDEVRSPQADQMLKKVQSLTFPDPPVAPQAFSRADIRRLVEEVLAEKQVLFAAAPAPAATTDPPVAPKNPPRKARRTTPRPRRSTAKKT
jgi:transcriptional regulator with XRE-family HTH domain